MWILLVAAVLSSLVGSLAQAETRQVCFDDRVGLNAPAVGSFYREFQVLAGPRGLHITDSGCKPGSIQLSLYRRSEGHTPDVLGAAYQQGSKVAPRLEIYLDPVLDLMPDSRCWNVAGRALARVAAHEVAHFIEQEQRHTEVGLLQARFSGAELASDDSYPFRWIRPRH
jgi:hypothetical protein